MRLGMGRGCVGSFPPACVAYLCIGVIPTQPPVNINCSGVCRCVRACSHTKLVSFLVCFVCLLAYGPHPAACICRVLRSIFTIPVRTL